MTKKYLLFITCLLFATTAFGQVCHFPFESFQEKMNFWRQNPNVQSKMVACPYPHTRLGTCGIIRPFWVDFIIEREKPRNQSDLLNIPFALFPSLWNSLHFNSFEEELEFWRHRPTITREWTGCHFNPRLNTVEIRRPTSISLIIETERFNKMQRNSIHTFNPRRLEFEFNNLRESERIRIRGSRCIYFMSLC